MQAQTSREIKQSADPTEVETRFAFGKNWQNYARHALTPEKIQHARAAFRHLYQGIDLRGNRGDAISSTAIASSI